MAELLSAAEAARMLGVSRTTIYRLINERQIPAIKLPGMSRCLLSRKWLERYVEVLAEQAEEERAEAVRRMEEEIAAMDSVLERLRLRKTG